MTRRALARERSRPTAIERDPVVPGAPVIDRRPLDGPAFYDDADVFAAYERIRSNPDGPAHTIERPIVDGFVGDVRGLAVLDLGCGDAAIGRDLLQQGARRYVGLDGSARMIERAGRLLDDAGGQVRLQDLESWDGKESGPFDIVLSRLALQYVCAIDRVIGLVHAVLKPSGLFVFSVEHPIMTSSYHGEIVEGIARVWHVCDYFREGDRADRWLGSVVRKQHRSLETYVREIRKHGFQLDSLSEGSPDLARVQNAASRARRLDVPICAVFRCIREA